MEKLTEFSKEILEMMNVCKKIEDEARKQFPDLSKEDLYKVCYAAMFHQLSFKV